MRTLRDLIVSLVLLLATAGTVVGGIFLAYAEKGSSPIQPIEKTLSTRTVTLAPTSISRADTATAKPSPALSFTSTSVPALTNTFTPSRIATIAASTTFTPSATASATATFTSSATTVVTVTLTSSATATVTASPLRASPSSTTAPCVVQPSWVAYTVKEGETMFRIARRYALSAVALQQGNCLPSSNIFAGQKISVPPVILTPDVTETPTAPPVPTITPAPLVIKTVDLATVVLDATRENGAIAHVRVTVSGGLTPYVYSEQGLGVGQPYDVIQIKTTCGAILSGTIRVVSADGQSATKLFTVYSLVCPAK